jgi:hypothetical protein
MADLASRNRTMNEKSKKSWGKKGGKLSARERRDLPKSDFALPGKGKGPEGKGAGAYPIPDQKHARLALSMVSAHGSSAEKAKVREKVKRKFPSIHVGGKSPLHDNPRSNRKD